MLLAASLKKFCLKTVFCSDSKLRNKNFPFPNVVKNVHIRLSLGISLKWSLCRMLWDCGEEADSSINSGLITANAQHNFFRIN